MNPLVFMGTPLFGRIILEALWKKYPIALVFSQPNRPFGRGRKMHSPECAIFAKEKNIPLMQPESVKAPAVLELLKSLRPDFIIVAAYGKILPKSILDLPQKDILNVHASLLPKYRGAAPIQWALLREEKETGISIMHIIEKMDAGPVFAKRALPIGEDTHETLTHRLAHLGADLLLEVLPKIAEGTLKPIEQDEREVTMAPAIQKDLGKINWDRPAHEIAALIRALSPSPGAYTFIDNLRLKIYDSAPLEETTLLPPGTVCWLNGGIHVACKGSRLVLKELQLEGRRRLLAEDFLKGHPLRIGMKLCS